MTLALQATHATASHCDAEALATAFIQHFSAGPLRKATAQVLAVGSVRPTPPDDATAAGGTEALPFVVMTRAPGLPLDTVAAILTAEAWERLCAELGRLLAELHSLSLSGIALLSHETAGARKGSAFAFWQGKDGMLLGWDSPCGHMQQKCCAECMLEQIDLQFTQDEMIKVRRALLKGNDAVSGSSAAGTMQEADSALRVHGTAGSEACMTGQSAEQPEQRRHCKCERSTQAQGGIWHPFADFLRERCASAPLELAGEASLPLRLHQQLDDYLPADPAILLPEPSLRAGASTMQPEGETGGSEEKTEQPLNGRPADPSSSSSQSISSQQDRAAASTGCLPMPALLHGDLIGQNIFVSERLTRPDLAKPESQHSQDASAAEEVDMCLIDFGDAGHGDPLYDLVLLLMSGLR